MQDRFHNFLPALEKWSGAVVAFTLLVIGVAGIYESHFVKHDGDLAEEEQAAMQVALAGA
jgi:hypothetical protein